MRRALITGIGGQDASYLADILLETGNYEVHGIYRRSSHCNLYRISHCRERIHLHQGDMGDPLSIDRIIREVQPHEIYNEADQDHVGWSHSVPSYNFDITYSAVGRLLETVRNFDKSIKVFQPCTAMMFGETDVCPQDESTQFNPRSSYACSKTGAYFLAKHYRQTHGMFVSTATLYNHDSPRRSEDYLLHKICASVVRIARGEQESLSLGNLNQRVDIGYSKEFMSAAHTMVQLPEPDDFVIGTGEALTIGEMVKHAWREASMIIRGEWADSELKRRPDPTFFSSGKLYELRADISKARSVFGFDPKFKVRETMNLILKHYAGANQ